MAEVLRIRVRADTVWQDSAGTTPAGVGDPVGRWEDPDRGISVTQDVTGNKPTLLQDANGHLYLSYDGADDIMTNASWLQAQPFSYIIVAQADQPNQIGFMGDAVNQGLYTDNTGDYRLRYGGNTDFSPGADTNLNVIAAVVDGASSRVYENGVAIGGPQNAGTAAWNELRVGGGPSGFRFVGKWYELAGFSHALNAAEVEQESSALLDYYSNPAGGGGDEVEVTFSHAASSTTGYGLSVSAQTASRTLAHTASGTTGYSLSVVAQPASLTLAHTASGTTGYGFSIAAGTPAGSVTLSHAASATAGYSLAPQAQASTRALGHAASTTTGHSLSVEAGAPGTDTVRLSHAASATTGYSLSVGAQPSTRTLGHGASETVGYGLAIGAGGQIIVLSRAASTTAGYGFDVTAQLARVALGYVDSVTVGYALRVQDGKAETPQVITLSLESTHMLTLSLESSHSLTLSIGN